MTAVADNPTTTTDTTDTSASTGGEAVDTAAAPSPFLVLTGTVRRVERLSPSFVRITLGGEGFDDFGPDGSTLDLRIKLLIADAGRPLPLHLASSDSWYTDWLALPEHERGHLRTYTARYVRGEGRGRELVVDFVLHGTDEAHPGESGPAAAWAAAAVVGDEVGVIGPRRGLDRRFSGVEFEPGEARRLLLVADETALPALSSILESLDPDTRGCAVVEVPQEADFLPVDAPAGVDVHWIARGDGTRGTASVTTLHSECGLPSVTDAATGPGAPDGDDDVWETPVYSASGEDVAAEATTPVGPDETYAWVAGDSATVKTVRRLLVGELGMPRHQVAFMGYWKSGATQS